MPALTYLVATSVDGFIADPNGDISAFSTGGDHVEHLISKFPETLPVHARAALGVTDTGDTFDTVIMGWNTFALGLREGVDSPYPHLRQFVVSRCDRSDEVGPGVELCEGDPRDLVNQLRATPSGSDIWLCGGGELAGVLLESIDRLVLKVNPFALGAGIPLFGPGGSARFTGLSLVAPPVAFESGVVMLDYRRTCDHE